MSIKEKTKSYIKGRVSEYQHNRKMERYKRLELKEEYDKEHLAAKMKAQKTLAKKKVQAETSAELREHRQKLKRSSAPRKPMGMGMPSMGGSMFGNSMFGGGGMGRSMFDAPKKKRKKRKKSRAKKRARSITINY